MLPVILSVDLYSKLSFLWLTEFYWWCRFSQHVYLRLPKTLLTPPLMMPPAPMKVFVSVTSNAEQKTQYWSPVTVMYIILLPIAVVFLFRLTLPERSSG